MCERSRTVGTRDGAITVRLIEIGEDACAPLLLPPGSRHLLRHPALEFAGGRDDSMAHIQELVCRFDRCEHVQPAVSRGLDECGEACFCEHLPQLECGGNCVVEIDAGLRVEVDAQLIGVVGVLGARRPRVEYHGVHLNGPHGGSHLVDDELRM